MTGENSLQGLYVHIPFCLKRCRYCSFYSTTGNIDEENYLEALFNHFKFLLERYNFNPLFQTLYFGGGTPSLMSLNFFSRFLVKLSKFMDIDKLKEITIEANPETLTGDYLKGLRKIGVNRISIGVQSTDNLILKKLGRVHDAAGAIKSVEHALEHFENVSVDFMIGIKGQENKAVEEIFNFPFLKDVKHISVYMLEGEKNRDLKADDDYCAEIYRETVQFLEDIGFLQYEISNFAKKGFESRHNSLYWQGNNYLGLGVSAHSFKLEENRGVRFSEQSTYPDFLQKKYVQESYNLDSDDLIKEFFMLGLRMKKGVCVEDFKLKWGVDPKRYFNTLLNEFNRFFVVENDCIKLSIEGFLLSNEIFEQILF